MKKKKVIPKLSTSVTENIEMFINQAEMSSGQARNTVEDMSLLTCKFLNTLTDSVTRDYVFWKVLNEYVYKKYNRPNHLREIYCNLTPKYFIVYKLIKDGELVYVGKTTDIQRRITNHAKNKEFDNVLLHKCLNEDEQTILEHSLIEHFRPKLNKMLNLNYVDLGVLGAVFEDISTFHLDYFNSTSHPIRINPTDHIWINCGFASTRMLKNKPYWRE